MQQHDLVFLFIIVSAASLYPFFTKHRRTLYTTIVTAWQECNVISWKQDLAAEHVAQLHFFLFSCVQVYYRHIYSKVKRHKEENISYVVAATYSKRILVPVLALVYNYTSIRCCNVMDVVPSYSMEDCILHQRISDYYCNSFFAPHNGVCSRTHNDILCPSLIH